MNAEMLAEAARKLVKMTEALERACDGLEQRSGHQEDLRRLSQDACVIKELSNWLFRELKAMANRGK